ncbi:MAG: phospholipase D family protein [Dehalococcoidia bacterium]|nr:phospholipase D family protein [Dehalococcoidia bacterium]
MPVTAFVPGLSGPESLDDALDLGRPADQVRIAAAHVSTQMILSLESGLRQAQQVEMQVGLDLLPQNAALLRLHQISQSTGRSIQLLQSLDGSIFHPKVYAAWHGDRLRAVVGSSNASTAAFGSNVEANLLVTATRGDAEAQAVEQLLNDVSAACLLKLSSRRMRAWNLPADRLPVVRPALNRRSAIDPEVVEAAISDGWTDDPSFRRGTVSISFHPKLQPLFSKADGVGQKMGNVHIPSQYWATIDEIADRYGSDLLLSWRFVTDEGATLFAHDEVRPSGFRVSGRPRPGKTSNHRAITAPPDEVAIPAVRWLRSIGITGHEQANVTYRLDADATPPRLWLVYEVHAPTSAFDATEVLR